MQIGRNEPCPCGSGRKYKQCCLNKKSTMSLYQKLLLVFGAFILIVCAVLLINSVRNYDSSQTAKRVWSEEHQHWHTVE